MKTKKLMLLFAALCLGFAASAQTADEIIAKHIDSIGGKEKLAQIKSVVITSSLQVMGADNPASTTLLTGVGYISQADINGQKIVPRRAAGLLMPLPAATTRNLCLPNSIKPVKTN